MSKSFKRNVDGEQLREQYFRSERVKSKNKRTVRQKQVSEQYEEHSHDVLGCVERDGWDD